MNYVAVVLRIALLFRPLKVLILVSLLIFAVLIGWVFHYVMEFKQVYILPLLFIFLSIGLIMALAINAKRKRNAPRTMP